MENVVGFEEQVRGYRALVAEFGYEYTAYIFPSTLKHELQVAIVWSKSQDDSRAPPLCVASFQQLVSDIRAWAEAQIIRDCDVRPPYCNPREELDYTMANLADQIRNDIAIILDHKEDFFGNPAVLSGYNFDCSCTRGRRSLSVYRRELVRTARDAGVPYHDMGAALRRAYERQTYGGAIALPGSRSELHFERASRLAEVAWNDLDVRDQNLLREAVRDAAGEGRIPAEHRRRCGPTSTINDHLDIEGRIGEAISEALDAHRGSGAVPRDECTSGGVDFLDWRRGN